MIVDMQYDGQQLDWKGMGKFKATSGLDGSQLPAEQCKRDAGPVPEGLYKVYLVELGAAVDDGTGICALRRHGEFSLFRAGRRRASVSRIG
jgi:hypothetical protein